MPRAGRANAGQRGVVVIGGGPAGLAAAISARESGCEDILLVERDKVLGGILNQCIHDGFGLGRFGESLSGPEYAARYAARLQELDIAVALNTIVLNITKDRKILISAKGSMKEIEARAIVLAMGCRERARGALSIPGNRPSGVYTAGVAQNLVNMENIMPGREIVILGSGDIGLIMARRMRLEGAEVKAVFEILPYPSGLPRNIQQCLVDYGIPLHLSSTVIEIVGQDRLEGVWTAKVNEERSAVPGTERFVKCDTLLLSVGLIPENELASDAGVALHPVTGGPVIDDSYMTNVPGIFSCGNALHVHDLVDWVSSEASCAGLCAARYALQSEVAGPRSKKIEVMAGEGVRYVMPQSISPVPEIPVALRVAAPSRGGRVEIRSGDVILKEEKHNRLHPAEMVWVSVDDLDLSGTSSLEIRVRT